MTQDSIFEYFRSAPIVEAEQAALVAREIVATRKEYAIEVVKPKKRGRPEGSKNKPKMTEGVGV